MKWRVQPRWCDLNEFTGRFRDWKMNRNSRKWKLMTAITLRLIRIHAFFFVDSVMIDWLNECLRNDNSELAFLQWKNTANDDGAVFMSRENNLWSLEVQWYVHDWLRLYILKWSRVSHPILFEQHHTKNGYEPRVATRGQNKQKEAYLYMQEEVPWRQDWPSWGW